MHKTALLPEVQELIVQRRGQLHVHDSFDPARTALVVVDMQVAFMAPDSPQEVPVAREIVPAINRLAGALRKQGGTVAWVYNTFDDAMIDDWSSFFRGTYGNGLPEKVIDNLRAGAPGQALWPDLDVQDGDAMVEKNRFSAFLPGSSDIEAQLKKRGVDTVLITGTLTNVCCESSARDAMMRNFHVVMISDGNATYTDSIHNASLNSMAITIADIMTTDEVIARLPAGAAVSAVAAE